MPILGSFGGVNVADMVMNINNVDVGTGLFLQAVIDFIIIAFAIFMAIKGMNSMKKAEEEAPAGPTSEELLAEIRDLMAK